MSGGAIAATAVDSSVTPVRIRPARCADCAIIARLFRISSEGVADYVWSRLADPGRPLLEVGAARYAREGVAFSYRNCLVAERDGAVAGMLHSFPMEGGDEAESDPVLRPYSELELPGTLYVSGLAVVADQRGRGLGSRLLQAAEARARDERLDGLSLIVFARNRGARALYRRHGYREVDRRTIVPHPMIHATGDAILMRRKL